MRKLTTVLFLFIFLHSTSGRGFGYPSTHSYGPLSPLYGTSGEADSFAGSSFLDADEYGHEQYSMNMNPEDGLKLDSDEDSMGSKYESMFGIASGSGRDKNDNGFFADDGSNNYFGFRKDVGSGQNSASGSGDSEGFNVRFLTNLHNGGDLTIGRPKGWTGSYRTLPNAVSIHRPVPSSNLYTGKSSGIRESAGNLQHDADTIGQQAQKLGVRVPAKGTVPGAMRRPRYQRVRPLRKPNVRPVNLTPMASETKGTFIGGAGVYQQRDNE